MPSTLDIVKSQNAALNTTKEEKWETGQNNINAVLRLSW
jgi:hypothetical protein